MLILTVIAICTSSYAMALRCRTPFSFSPVEFFRSKSRVILQIGSMGRDLADIQKLDSFLYKDLLSGKLLRERNFYLDESTDQLYFCDFLTGIYLLKQGEKKLVFDWKNISLNFNIDMYCFCVTDSTCVFAWEAYGELTVRVVDFNGFTIHSFSMSSLGEGGGLYYHRESQKYFYYMPGSKYWALVALDCKRDQSVIIKEETEIIGNFRISSLDANHVFVDGFIVNVNDYSIQWGEVRTQIIDTSGRRAPYRKTRKIEFAENNIFIGIDCIDMQSITTGDLLEDIVNGKYSYLLKITLYRFVDGRLVVCGISTPQRVNNPSISLHNSIYVDALERYLVYSDVSTCFVLDLSTLVLTSFCVMSTVRTSLGMFFLTTEGLLCQTDIIGRLQHLYSTSFANVQDVVSSNDNLYILADGFLFSLVSFSDAKPIIVCRTDAKSIAINGEGILLISDDKITLKFFDSTKQLRLLISDCTDLQKSIDGKYILCRQKNDRRLIFSIGDLTCSVIDELSHENLRPFSLLLSFQNGELTLREPFTRKLHLKCKLTGVTEILDYWNGKILAKKGEKTVCIELANMTEIEVCKYNPSEKYLISGESDRFYVCRISDIGVVSYYW